MEPHSKQREQQPPNDVGAAGAGWELGHSLSDRHASFPRNMSVGPGIARRFASFSSDRSWLMRQLQQRWKVGGGSYGWPDLQWLQTLAPRGLKKITGFSISSAISRNIAPAGAFLVHAPVVSTDHTVASAAEDEPRSHVNSVSVAANAVPAKVERAENVAQHASRQTGESAASFSPDTLRTTVDRDLQAQSSVDAAGDSHAESTGSSSIDRAANVSSGPAKEDAGITTKEDSALRTCSETAKNETNPPARILARTIDGISRAISNVDAVGSSHYESATPTLGRVSFDAPSSVVHTAYTSEAGNQLQSESTRQPSVERSTPTYVGPPIFRRVSGAPLPGSQDPSDRVKARQPYALPDASRSADTSQAVPALLHVTDRSKSESSSAASQLKEQPSRMELKNPTQLRVSETEHSDKATAHPDSKSATGHGAPIHATVVHTIQRPVNQVTSGSVVEREAAATSLPDNQRSEKMRPAENAASPGLATGALQRSPETPVSPVSQNAGIRLFQRHRDSLIMRRMEPRASIGQNKFEAHTAVPPRPVPLVSGALETSREARPAAYGEKVGDAQGSVHRIHQTASTPSSVADGLQAATAGESHNPADATVQSHVEIVPSLMEPHSAKVAAPILRYSEQPSHRVESTRQILLSERAPDSPVVAAEPRTNIAVAPAVIGRKEEVSQRIMATAQNIIARQFAGRPGHSGGLVATPGLHRFATPSFRDSSSGSASPEHRLAIAPSRSWNLTHRVSLLADRSFGPSQFDSKAAGLLASRRGVANSATSAMGGSSASASLPSLPSVMSQGSTPPQKLTNVDMKQLANRVYELLVRRLASEQQRRGR